MADETTTPLDLKSEIERIDGLIGSPEAFEEWLRARDSQDEVGTPEDGWACPIATWQRSGWCTHPGSAGSHPAGGPRVAGGPAGASPAPPPPPGTAGSMWKPPGR